MGHITGGIKSNTVRMILTHIRYTEATACVTLIPGVTVSIIITLAGVVTQVTDRGGVLTVEATIVAS